MALWKDAPTGTVTGTVPGSPAPGGLASTPYAREQTNVAPLTPDVPRRAAPAPAPAPRHDMKESFLSADLTIEGKIVGTGHVRIAGRFQGDVQVDGNLSLDAGARLEGNVKASVVSVGGELIGNIENVRKVELLETGVINGDVKAGSLTVAAGSRMRGQVEFGYDAEGRSKAEKFGSA